MFSAFFTGFFLGLTLIVAIGSQNAFVLRQGILNQHVFYIALFCSISDSLLIILGITGISYFLNDFIIEYSKIIFGFAALWLSIYGLFRLNSVFKTNYEIISNKIESRSLLHAISVVAIFTFANPHVYLDTIILIGSFSQQFDDLNKAYFAFGCSIASFFWFFSISYGARLIAPIMQSRSNWRILDTLIASIMFIIAFNLASEGGWF